MKLTDDVKQRKQNILNNSVQQINGLENKQNLVRFLHRGKPIKHVYDVGRAPPYGDKVNSILPFIARAFL